MCLAIIWLEQQCSRSHHGILLLTGRFFQRSSTHLSQQLCHSLCWAFQHWKQGVKWQLAQYLPEVGREHRVLQGHSMHRAPDVQLAATAVLPNHASQMYGSQVSKKQGVLRRIYPLSQQWSCVSENYGLGQERDNPGSRLFCSTAEQICH